MEITFLGQAGLFIETRHGSILCDPWFNTAYFASWFPFPSNERVDIERLKNPTYLYVSHLHHDHFDPTWLREHVSKDTTVLLPDYPLDLLERALRDCGFTKFVHTKNGQMLDLDGLRVLVTAAVAPTDGPIGDSGLIVDDGEVRIFDQNDSRPIDLDLLTAHGPYDAHFLQFSGAIWYPMVYQLPEKMMDVLGRKKRENEMARALRYANEIGAANVIPSAGPPCFLDDPLFGFNDFDRNPANTFPDQTVFLELMHDQGRPGGALMIPGSVMSLTRAGCDVRHPIADEEVARIFTEKRAYLEAYQQRQRPTIEAQKATWVRGKYDILAELKAWFEPLMQEADITAAGINGLVVMDFLDQPGIVLDFHTRTVYRYDGQEWDYYLKLDAALVETCIDHHYEDWVNHIFLSCRFEAQRKGTYNEYVYNWFKCLSEERLQYAEGYYSEKAPEQQFFEAAGYRIQRRCPHLKADLTRFGHIEDGVLTCTLHGWQFELETGRCLTTDDRRIYAVKLDAPGDDGDGGGMGGSGSDPAVGEDAPFAPATTAQPASSASATPRASVPGLEANPAAKRAAGNGSSADVHARCGHCWYHPNEVSRAQRPTDGAQIPPPPTA